ncbi:uncharacterized protein LOC115973795 [Quercus lobata]|uniref:uncharacterized protein LOC115973795 n=1 Tax=Quercus lobata TaxID=97700 RepID=UPI0012489BDF|nr:uncharacterized protein LOC115973795 [Quercus lobata]
MKRRIEDKERQGRLLEVNNFDREVIRPPKKPPLILRMMVILLFGMACGVYICSIYSIQISTYKIAELLNIKVMDQQCNATNVKPSEIPYVHYPKPKTYDRGECACNPVRFFAILSLQRTGSGWFETLLNSHINVTSNGEVFTPRERRNNITTIVKTMNKVYRLDWFNSASKNECTAAVGFKWMINQGFYRHRRQILKYFKKRGISSIFLFRKNILRRMISVLANSHDKDARSLNGTHQSHVYSRMEARILAKYKPTINATLLLSELRQEAEETAETIDFFKRTRHMVLYYEDLINRTNLNFKEVQEFLRLPYRELSSSQVKIHTAPLSMQIQNWEAVREALEGTAYERFLYEN